MKEWWDRADRKHREIVARWAVGSVRGPGIVDKSWDQLTREEQRAVHDTGPVELQAAPIRPAPRIA